MPPVLIVPGRGGSGPEHWQSHLERRFPAARRVEQENWDAPDLASWSARIDAVVRATLEPPLVIAHSFGCLALAHAVLHLGTPVGSSYLVAPADPARFGIADSEVLHALPLRSDFIASTDDPWLNIDKAHRMAQHWQSRLHVLGAVGHINVESGFASWPEMLEWALMGCIDTEVYLVEAICTE